MDIDDIFRLPKKAKVDIDGWIGVPEYPVHSITPDHKHVNLGGNEYGVTDKEVSDGQVLSKSLCKSLQALAKSNAAADILWWKGYLCGSIRCSHQGVITKVYSLPFSLHQIHLHNSDKIFWVSMGWIHDQLAAGRTKGVDCLIPTPADLDRVLIVGTKIGLFDETPTGFGTVHSKLCILP